MELDQVVVFKLQGHDFGIDIKKVLEILIYEPIRPIPEAPDFIEGILNVRGMVYTIVNLRKRLSMSELGDDKNSKIILLHLDKYRVGLLVDSVAEILNVDQARIEDSPHTINKKHKGCVKSIIKRDENMVIVLDVDAIISDENNFYVQGVSNEKNSGSDSK